MALEEEEKTRATVLNFEVHYSFTLQKILVLTLLEQKKGKII